VARRASWKRYQGRLDPCRPVFIDRAFPYRANSFDAGAKLKNGDGYLLSRVWPSATALACKSLLLPILDSLLSRCTQPLFG
jgi:hypothetical protein